MNPAHPFENVYTDCIALQGALKDYSSCSLKISAIQSQMASLYNEILYYRECQREKQQIIDRYTLIKLY